MADATHVTPALLADAGAAVAAALERAAAAVRPPVPAPGISPGDRAAEGLAGAMGTRLAGASAVMGPRGPIVRSASAAAAQGFLVTDEQNAARIEAVAQRSVPVSGEEGQ